MPLINQNHFVNINLIISLIYLVINESIIVQRRSSGSNARSSGAELVFTCTSSGVSCSMPSSRTVAQRLFLNKLQSSRRLPDWGMWICIQSWYPVLNARLWLSLNHRVTCMVEGSFFSTTHKQKCMAQRVKLQRYTEEILHFANTSIDNR